MKPIALLPLAVLLLLNQASLIRADCNAKSNSGEAKCRKDDSPDLVKHKASGEKTSSEEQSPSTSGSSPASPASPASASPASPASPSTGRASSEEFDCILIEALQNISVLLTDINEQFDLQVLIQELQDEILVDVSLTDIEKVVKCSYKIKHFMKSHFEIEQVMAFEQINGWEGSFFDFTYVSIDLEADSVESVVALDSNEDCTLFEGLLNATRNDSAKFAACEVLVEEMQAVLMDFTWTFAQKMAKLHLLIAEFYVANPSWQSFFEGIEIKGFGSFEAFDDVGHGYQRSLTISTVLVGSSDSDCPLLKALADAYANTSFPISIRSQLKQYHDVLLSQFASVTDIDQRMAIVSAQYWQLIIMEPFIVKYLSVVSINDVSGNPWGLFYDLTWCSQFCNNSGSCGCMSCGLGGPDCKSRVNLIAVSSQNTTILTDTLTAVYKSWNTTQKLSFNSCFNMVRNAIWNKSQFPNVTSQVNEIVKDFKSFNANNKVKQQVLFNVTIDVWDGEIGDFVNCGNM